MDDICEVIITAQMRLACQFTRDLVTERLAACGHNITPIRSIYRWQGEIYDVGEARVALHTRRSLVGCQNKPGPSVRGSVCHRDRCIPGNPAYLQWVNDETSDR